MAGYPSPDSSSSPGGAYREESRGHRASPLDTGRLRRPYSRLRLALYGIPYSRFRERDFSHSAGLHTSRPREPSVAFGRERNGSASARRTYPVLSPPNESGGWPFERAEASPLVAVGVGGLQPALSSDTSFRGWRSRVTVITTLSGS